MVIDEVIKKVVPAQYLDQHDHLPRQSDRPLRHRRPAGRLRSDRPQDHRRHLRRLRPPRRRRLLGQGSRARSIAAPPTWRATSPRTSSPPGWRTSARCSSPTRSASPQPLSVLIDTFDTGEVSDELIGKLVREHFELTPARHHRDARSEAADLRAHRVLRPLRPQAGGRLLHLGAHRQGRGAAQRRRRRPRGARRQVRLTTRHRSPTSSTDGGGLTVAPAAALERPPGAAAASATRIAWPRSRTT